MKKRCHQQSQNCTLDGTRSSRSDALSFYRKGWNLCFVTKQNNSSPFCCFYSLISRVVCSCFSQPCWSKDPQMPEKCQDKSKHLRQMFLGWWLFLGVPIRAEVHDNNQIFPEFILYYKRFQAWWNTPGLQSGKIRIKLWRIWLMPGSAWKDNHFLKGFPAFPLKLVKFFKV